MDELKKRGGKLLYDPQFIVHRRPRHTLKAFVQMLLNYGRGRAEQFRLHPTFGSILNFVPPLFCLYLVLLPLLMKLAPWNIHFEQTSGDTRGLITSYDLNVNINLALLPMTGYALALLLQTLGSAFQHGVINSILALPLLAITHIFYGLGFWRGLFTKLTAAGRVPPTDVTLEKIPM